MQRVRELLGDQILCALKINSAPRSDHFPAAAPAHSRMVRVLKSIVGWPNDPYMRLILIPVGVTEDLLGRAGGPKEGVLQSCTELTALSYGS